MSQRVQLPGRAWGRREFLVAGGSLLAWPVLAGPASAAFRRLVKWKDYPFQLGVASGEPLPDGFVLWTRLAPEPLVGGGMPEENIEVTWRVATDEALKHVVAEGTAVAGPELAHSVHVEVSGLEPARWYWYQFTAGGEASPVGRTRTAPRREDLPERLRFAFASCQHWEYGFYTAYEHMAQEELDLIVHLGDYIYEGAAGKKAVRQHVGRKCDSLEDYRNRLAQYRTDRHLQSAHRLFPWIVTWDDHEVENNYAGAISELPDFEPAKFLERRARAYQAYYEHMPLRRMQLPQGPNLELYRRIDFGRLAQFAVLDTRQYRTDQPCGDNNKPPCKETEDPGATLLGDAQEQWLYAGLKASPAQWNVLAQQVMMARVDRLPGPLAAFSMDQWPGYEVNRQRVLKFFAEAKPSNPIVLTGDIHNNWVNDLQVDSTRPDSPVVATEFVGTSITSGGDGSEGGLTGSLTLSENPFVKFYNNQRGYVACDVTPHSWTSHYRIVPYVTRPGAPLATAKSFVVADGRPGAVST